MSKLEALLAPGAVALDVTVTDWRSAIRIAGRLLEQSGAATGDYTRSMIETVEKKGPYIVVAPGFAFAHARPSDAVKETAISWVRLEEPVRFGHTSNDPVTLVVALAARDKSAHIKAMKELARVLGDGEKMRCLHAAASESELREALIGTAVDGAAVAGPSRDPLPTSDQVSSPDSARVGDAVESKGKILTVCGNGLGTSLFLKNTLDELLDTWGWSPYLTVEATDTISAKGRAKEADFLLTSGEIAAALGDVGVPVYVIEDFTSASEIDRALRSLYVIPSLDDGAELEEK